MHPFSLLSGKDPPREDPGVLSKPLGFAAGWSNLTGFLALLLALGSQVAFPFESKGT